VHENEAKLSKLFVRAHLSDKSVFIDSKIEEVVGIAELTEKLGGTVSGLSSVSIDVDNRTNLDKLSGLSPSTSFIIGNGELFEKANLISKKEINFYIGGAYGSAFAREQGAIPVSLENTAYYGYTGLKKLVTTIKNAERFNAASEDKLYKTSWLTKSGNWYVKQEVK
jgi:nitrogenase molybdenum-iron protein alpha chain